ncbi:hypothetical protein JTB14_033856 [Gonioctena quinquepunctata]|nr:hypothetical protein JTB14_033856 [Gonioctena quinquepunctata]
MIFEVNGLQGISTKRHKLVNANYLTKKEQEEYRILRRHLSLEREKGEMNCFIRRNKLVVNDNEFTSEELLRIEEEEVLPKTNSTPATPTQKLLQRPESPEEQPRTLFVASRENAANELKKNQAKIEKIMKLRSNSSSLHIGKKN